MSADRPLSGPQEIALAKLASATDARARRVERGEDEGVGWEWCRSWWVGRTVDSLERLGLVEQRWDGPLLGYGGYECRITEAGREMLASMGD